MTGEPMVVNLWATWCPPCRREMPVLAKAQEERGDVTFVFVNQGESESEIRDYLRESHLQLSNVLLDPFSSECRSPARAACQRRCSSMPTAGLWTPTWAKDRKSTRLNSSH